MGNRSDRSNHWIALLLMCWGVWLLLEGLQITHFGKPAEGVPYALIAVVGLVLIFAGIAALIKTPGSYWKDLLACLITALMACIGGWISIYSNEDDIEGNMMFLSELLGIDIGRLVFGFGALISAAISLYAWRLFWRKLKAGPEAGANYKS